MKKFFMVKLILFLVVFSIALMTTVAASSDGGVNTSINSVTRLGLIQGDTNGNLRLDDKIIRSEMITLMVRTLGLENENNANNIKLTFKDIDSSHWAYNYIKTAIKNNLITGYPDHTIAPDKNITYSEALTLIIRVLGYTEILQSGNWPDNVISKCNELGISKGLNIPKDKQVTRGEVSSLLYNSLTVNFKN